MILYGDSGSGNCLKAKWVADYLGREYEWREVDVTSGYTRSAEFLAVNPAGQVPCLAFPDGGGHLAQSNAIMLFLAEGSDLIPADAFARAKMLEWMFWEQYNHEPAIAVRRYQKKYLGKPDSEIDPALMDKGEAALALMEAHLGKHDYFAPASLSLADIALAAYTRVAPEGGFDLQPYPKIRDWLTRVERKLGLDTA